MIQEIEPKRFDNTFQIKAPGDTDYALFYEKNLILVEKQGEDVLLPEFSMLPVQIRQRVEYLFSIDDRGFFLVQDAIEGLTDPFLMYPVQSIREARQRWIGFAGVTGWQLCRWKQNHKFCSRCGAALAQSERERALLCPSCGLTEYPRISPAVIVAVSDGDRLLMIKGKRSTDRYHLIAGFVEIGETMEQAVRREVMEEAGVEITDIRYYKNQPWSISDTLMVGFTARLCGDDVLKPQESEISDARWFHRSEIPEVTTTSSMGSELTNNFRLGIL